jgi:hypothetical protein
MPSLTRFRWEASEERSEYRVIAVTLHQVCGGAALVADIDQQLLAASAKENYSDATQ